MCRLLIALVMMLSYVASYASTSFKNETLNYVITYKWGLITKDAGEATLTLRNSGANYSLLLTAKTKPWADKVFQVRDTLRATMQKSTLRPLNYSKISHEGGKYGRDDIKFTYSGNTVLGKCSRKREKKGKVSNSTITLSAQGKAFDMLSVFYYLRTLDFESMQKNKVMKVSIFSGSKSETLTIRNMGVETIKLRNGSTAKAYHIKFNFTTEGSKKSSDDMDTWISVSSPHIPYLLEGGLPIGKVKCYWVN